MDNINNNNYKFCFEKLRNIIICNSDIFLSNKINNKHINKKHFQPKFLFSYY